VALSKDGPAKVKHFRVLFNSGAVPRKAKMWWCLLYRHCCREAGPRYTLCRRDIEEELADQRIKFTITKCIDYKFKVVGTCFVDKYLCAWHEPGGLTWESSRFVSKYLKVEFSKLYTCSASECPHQLPGIQLVEDNSIAIPSAVDKHGVETKRCLECRRGYIIGRYLFFRQPAADPRYGGTFNEGLPCKTWETPLLSEEKK